MANETRSVLQMLLQPRSPEELCGLLTQSNNADVLSSVSDLDHYIATVMADIDEGRQDISYNPIVIAKPGMQLAATLQQDRCLKTLNPKPLTLFARRLINTMFDTIGFLVTSWLIG